MKVRNWTPGRLAANLIHKFRFDGIQYDRCIDTTPGTPPITLDLQVMIKIWNYHYHFHLGVVNLKHSEFKDGRKIWGVQNNFRNKLSIILIKEDRADLRIHSRTDLAEWFKKWVHGTISSLRKEFDFFDCFFVFSPNIRKCSWFGSWWMETEKSFRKKASIQMKRSTNVFILFWILVSLE